MHVVIRSDSLKEMNEYTAYGKVLKYTQLFSLWAMHLGKRTLKTLKLFESNISNCCLQITTADLCKIGPKMR